VFAIEPEILTGEEAFSAYVGHTDGISPSQELDSILSNQSCDERDQEIQSEKLEYSYHNLESPNTIRLLILPPSPNPEDKPKCVLKHVFL